MPPMAPLPEFSGPVSENIPPSAPMLATTPTTASHPRGPRKHVPSEGRDRDGDKEGGTYGRCRCS
jgi:hypothetical protein